MCGILLYLCSCDFDILEIINRGPDSINKTVKKNIVSFVGCVLHHQGEFITSQPLLLRNSLLLWNGENYDNTFGNDGEELLKKISDLSEFEALNVLASINGPFATIYYNNESEKVYFGRDLLGRRSLLCGLNVTGEIVILSSVIIEGCAHVDKWVELPALGIYKSSIKKDGCIYEVRLQMYEFYSLKYATEELQRVGLSNVAIENEILLTDDPDITQITTNDILSHKEVVDTLLRSLECSVRSRVNNVHGQCSECLLRYGFDLESECFHSKVAILFSGGVDSAVVAALANRFVRPEDSIDLLNVSFHVTADDTNESADRISGLRCLEELKLCNPSRRWNFVKIDVYPEELTFERNNRIAKLIQPCDSVLDDSIGCALWFAARGKGQLLSDNSDYVSPARVVLTGIGADELMAGYSRHRNLFEKFGYDRLQEELDLELKRIASRNMGRDDRVISSHGREGRFPFLDKDVISFLQSLPIYLKCDLTKERGVGEKMILRSVARDHLQLIESSHNLKRAIQFGSKIAKVDKLVKGGKASQKCHRLEF